MSSSRFAVFLANVFAVWAAMHVYVFWRLSTVPWVAHYLSRRSLFLVAAVLWASYPVARILESWKWDSLAVPLEFIAATWIGILFLFLATLLAVDVVTLGGWLAPSWMPAIRSWALVLAAALSLVALVQGFRPPVVRDYEVTLPGLPPERDGLVLVEVSDLHLGTLIGGRWTARLARRIQELRPDLLVLVGDIVDGNVGRVESLQPVLRGFRAPLGVWAVTGNHEYYAGPEASVRLFEGAGFSVLRDRWAEVVPGLVLAGVDDLTARRQFGLENYPAEKALAGRPPGGAILLSHSPWQAEMAAKSGAGLMLSGHTHNGQLWPFNYLVGLKYPMLVGRYEVSGMPLIVCRGTGTWGPRMRLWRPGEIIRIKLRS
jgi:predicted MPP superfamily phosphohydrolase